MSFTFSFVPEFVAKTQNPSESDPKFGEFNIHLSDFVDGERESLLCPVRALKKYISRTERCCFACPTSFCFV